MTPKAKGSRLGPEEVEGGYTWMWLTTNKQGPKEMVDLVSHMFRYPSLQTYMSKLPPV